MYGSLLYQMDQRSQDRERHYTHKHWSDAATKRRERRWTARLASVFHTGTKSQAPAVQTSTKPRFAA